MKQLIFVLFLITTFYACKKDPQSNQFESTEITTFYLIRHAEKNRKDSTNKNPNLNLKGLLRAEKWKNVFKNISFDAIYSTDYNRTRETATPTALKNKLELTIYNPNTIAINELSKKHSGKNVLIVGHSNTTPQVVNKFLGSDTYEDIDDNNNANLYIVTVKDDIVSSSVLFIE